MFLFHLNIIATFYILTFKNNSFEENQYVILEANATLHSRWGCHVNLSSTFFLSIYILFETR